MTTKAHKATITFEGNEYEYDPAAAMSYKNIKAISNPGNPKRFFEAIEDIFKGRDEEYAESFKDSMEGVARLVSEIIKAEGAKN